MSIYIAHVGYTLFPADPPSKAEEGGGVYSYFSFKKNK